MKIITRTMHRPMRATSFNPNEVRMTLFCQQLVPERLLLTDEEAQATQSFRVLELSYPDFLRQSELTRQHRCLFQTAFGRDHNQRGYYLETRRTRQFMVALLDEGLLVASTEVCGTGPSRTLENVMVRADYRSRKLSHVLIKKALTWARDHGSYVDLSCRPDNVELYRKHGFMVLAPAQSLPGLIVR